MCFNLYHFCYNWTFYPIFFLKMYCPINLVFKGRGGGVWLWWCKDFKTHESKMIHSVLQGQANEKAPMVNLEPPVNLTCKAGGCGSGDRPGRLPIRRPVAPSLLQSVCWSILQQDAECWGCPDALAVLRPLTAQFSRKALVCFIMSLDCWTKLEHPGKTHTGTGRRCKRHNESLCGAGHNKPRPLASVWADLNIETCHSPHTESPRWHKGPTVHFFFYLYLKVKVIKIQTRPRFFCRLDLWCEFKIQCRVFTFTRFWKQHDVWPLTFSRCHWQIWYESDSQLYCNSVNKQTEKHTKYSTPFPRAVLLNISETAALTSFEDFIAKREARPLVGVVWHKLDVQRRTWRYDRRRRDVAAVLPKQVRWLWVPIMDLDIVISAKRKHISLNTWNEFQCHFSCNPEIGSW